MTLFKEAEPVLRSILKIFWILLGFTFKTVWVIYQLALGAILLAVLWLFFQVTDYLYVKEIRELVNKNPEMTSFMLRDQKRWIREKSDLDSTQENLFTIDWVPLDSIPLRLRDLALVAEDSRFFQHIGFDLEELEYAIVANHQKGKKARGASTISQQVAKNLFLSGEKSYERKLREAMITVLLEQVLTKERILELYLNIAQFGPGIYGISAGAQHHFGKRIQDLDLQESISLVCLLPSPLKWSPKRNSGVYQSHRSRVTRNYALYRGFRKDLESVDPDWHLRSFEELAEVIGEQKWSTLRTQPAHVKPTPEEPRTVEVAGTQVIETRKPISVPPAASQADGLSPSSVDSAQATPNPTVTERTQSAIPQQAQPEPIDTVATPRPDTL